MAAIDIDSIRSASRCPSLVVEVLDEAGSTNRLLMEAPFGAAPALPRLLAVARQTAGRGRQGRGWVMEPGRSAAFSVAVERPARGARPAVGLSIAAGVATAEALAPLAADIGLKWPNDLQRAGRKFGGILVESRRSAGGRETLERYVIGIGLNLLAPRDAGGAIGQPVTGLFDGERLPVPVERIIGEVGAAVAEAAGRFFREGLSPFAGGWQRFDALRGRQVVALVEGRVSASGVAIGIDAEGALVIETEAGPVAVRSGEVSVRAVAAPLPLAGSSLAGS